MFWRGIFLCVYIVGCFGAAANRFDFGYGMMVYGQRTWPVMSKAFSSVAHVYTCYVTSVARGMKHTRYNTRLQLSA